ncbi:MAG TPA: CPBP family intramembrane glutamic endopeptidase [Verrucomicrobiae bacterium]|jgi:membrane protease YdiL (CAAX protease family)|nr:CPBP family intramembrane glutamic endopeptidase [Verrucomicrobiae bacterium]
MFFARTITTGRLSEKPWRTDAIVRLIASVIVCVMIGAVVSSAINYFGGAAQPSPAIFIAGSAAALACFVGALFVLARPWPFEKFLRNLLILLVCIYSGFLLMWAITRLTGQHEEVQNTTLRVLLAVVAFQGAALVLVHFFLREHHLNWSEGFGFNNHPGHALLLGAVIGLAALPVIWTLQAISIQILQHLTFHPQEQETVSLLRATEQWSSRALLGIATIAIAPVAEEVIFRGILYPAVKRAGYPRMALWGTSLLFGLIHFNLGTFLPLTFLALVLACLYEYTGNLLACITVHCVFNAANFVALYLQQK